MEGDAYARTITDPPLRVVVVVVVRRIAMSRIRVLPNRREGKSGGPEITIATWIKIVSAANWQRLFDIGVDPHSPSNPPTGSKYMNLVPETETNTMAFGISTDGFNNERALATAMPTVGVWTHVAVVLASDGSGKLYIDGALAVSNPSLGLSPKDLGSIDYAIIGKSLFSKDPHLDAEIDEFRVYGRALAAAGVLALRQLTGP